MSILIVTITLLGIVGCSEKTKIEEFDVNIDVLSEINGYDKILESKSFKKLETISTPAGFKSIIEISDSLRDNNFINDILLNLRSESIQYATSNDESFDIILRENADNSNLGRPIGEINFTLSGDNFLINEYKRYSY
jgi:hypothetical protein